MATIYTVSSSEELYDALAKAQGGDEIRLDSGDYGDLTLNSKSGFDIGFDAPVTITSLDADAPASFSRMSLEGVENLTIEDVVFDYTFDAEHEVWFAPFRITDSNNVTVRNSLFDGDVASGLGEVDDGYGFAKGLTIGGSENISIEGNEFTTWHRGMVVSGSNDIEVVGNDIHSIRSDGMDFLEVQNVLIEENYIHDFEASFSSGDHRDMIQFWTNGTDEPSTDIVIRNNILDIGDGDRTQSIFMRNDLVDRGLAGEEMYYQNVLIEDNVILNGHLHGITVGETNGLTIQSNTILSIGSADSRFSSTPTINVASDSKSVHITQNAVAQFSVPEDAAEFTISDNAYIQAEDTNAVGHYSSQFVMSSLDDGLRDYVVAPDSMIASLGAGSSLLQFNESPAALMAHFSVYSSDDNPEVIVFDGSLTADKDGAVEADTATFVWDFGDGTVLEGINGEHAFSEPGWYDVSLTVISNSGTVSNASAKVGVVGEDVLSFNQDSGGFESEAYGLTETLEHTFDASVELASQKALVLQETGLSLAIDENDILRFFGTDAFEMSMTLQAGRPNQSAGEVMRIHGSMIASVENDGDLTVRLFTNAGEEVIVRTSGFVINDGQAHDISIKFEGDADNIQLFIDGQLAASAIVAGDMPEMQSWGIYFGNPWGQQNFDGYLTAFDLDVPAAAYPEFGGALQGFSALEADHAQDLDVSTKDTSDDTSAPTNEESSESGPSLEDVKLPTLDDYVLQIAELSAENLRGDVKISGEDALQLNGGTDHVHLGRFQEFENSDSLSFEVEFSKFNAMDSDMRLVWNHTHIGLSVERDGLKLYVGQPDNPFHKAITISDLGLDDTEAHTVRVITDDVSDRLQVILDDDLVYSETDIRDIEVSEEGSRDWGWTLGSSWSHDFRGEIYAFSIDDTAEFVSDDMLLV